MTHNPNTYTSRERMSDKKANPSLFNKNAEEVLKEGLRAATIALEALTDQNKILNKDIEKLKGKVRILEDRALQNLEERE
jgi:3-oxoacyl-[acyl-carrier-protein] synthase III